MSQFAYSAINGSGQKVLGQINAVSRGDALQALAQQALMPLTLMEAKMTPLRSQRVKPAAIAAACSLLADQLDTGVPLLKALRVMEQQTSSPGLKTALARIAERVADGMKRGGEGARSLLLLVEEVHQRPGHPEIAGGGEEGQHRAGDGVEREGLFARGADQEQAGAERQDLVEGLHGQERGQHARPLTGAMVEATLLDRGQQPGPAHRRVHELSNSTPKLSSTRSANRLDAAPRSAAGVAPARSSSHSTTGM